MPDNTKAILHFHWGREHVILPEHNNIKLAKKLLEHKKVLCIIGMHAHRTQGIIQHNGKKAYMCLGNFLFPNFYIKPPTQITYPEKLSKKVMSTTVYHFVGKLTYKRNILKNRLSLLVFFDTESEEITHLPVVMHKNKPTVKELSGLRKKHVLYSVNLYSLLYSLPKFLYIPVQKANAIFNKSYRNLYAFSFLLRQNGLKWTINKTMYYLRKEIK